MMAEKCRPRVHTPVHVRRARGSALCADCGRFLIFMERTSDRRAYWRAVPVNGRGKANRKTEEPM